MFTWTDAAAVEPRPLRLFRLTSALIGGVLTVMIASWISDDAVARVSTDWTAFDNAAERVFTGEEIYRSYEQEPLPYLYPPFMLWAALPLKWLGFWGSFALSVALSLVTTVLAYRIVLRSGPHSAANRAVLTGAVWCGTTISAVVIGQYSGLWVLALAGALWFWERDRAFAAGVCLAMLAAKPNLGLAVPFLLLWARSWTALRGLFTGWLALLLASIPFGVRQWWNFAQNVFETADVQIQGLAPVQKMVTAQASFQSMLGLASDSPWVAAFVATVVLTTGVAVLALWAPSTLAESSTRALGGLALFLVAASPRLYFYDATLMVFGVLCLWSSRSLWRSTSRRRLVAWLVAGLWVGSFGGIFLELNVLVGPLTAAVLVLWALDTRSGKALGAESEGNEQRVSRPMEQTSVAAVA